MAIPKCSVNVKWVEEWDKNDIMKWVKSLQEFQLFEGKNTKQANIMYRIINQRKVTAKNLAKCDTIQSIKKLFDNRIANHTAVVLLESLNMERSLYQKRELSKLFFQQQLQGNRKWIPTIGEKIRLIDTKYKPYRSYESTIKKIEQSRILVSYDGYPDSHGVWIRRKEWQQRITLIHLTTRAPVNVKCLEEWHKVDILKWIKSLQDRAEFQGKKTQQANNMIKIINQRNLTGRNLAKCHTMQSLIQLFEGKINLKTAWVLRESCNLERAMFQKRKQSQRIIKQGKWKPRVGEKVRVVDTKYLPHKSYQSTIKKIGKGKIFICYNGYDDDQGVWVKREEWMGRITILQNNRSKIQSQQQQDDVKFPSFADKNFYVGQKIECMDGNNQKWYNARIKNVKAERVLVQWSSPRWQSSKYDQWIVKAHYDIRMRPRRSSQQTFLNIGNTSMQHQSDDEGIGNNSDNSAQRDGNEVIKNWSSGELLQWIKTIGLKDKWQDIMIGIIESTQSTGQDWLSVNNYKDLAKKLNIQQPMLANRVFREFKKAKQNPPDIISDPNGDIPPSFDEIKINSNASTGVNGSVSIQQSTTSSTSCDKHMDEWTTNELQEWIINLNLGNGAEQKIVDAIFEQEVTGEEFNSINEVSEIIDSFEIEEIVATKIFSALTALRTNDANNNQSIPQQQAEKKRLAFEYKHIDGWTCNELQAWLLSLNLDDKNERKVVQAVAEQDITGADFSSMSEVIDIMDSFEIKKAPATTILTALKSARQATVNENANAKNEIISGRGIIGLDNLRNTCFINSVIQALLQTPGLVPYLRKFAASYGTKNNCGSMLDAFIEVASVAMQSSGRNDSIPPNSIVKQLRDSDVKFAYGEQGDALSAVSKMIELLDKDIIAMGEKNGKRKDVKKHTGSWHVELKSNDPDFEEEEIIEGQFMLYNPYESVIREYIHFVERNIFTCMKCGWQEARYDIKEKLLLPLKDYSTKICVDVYFSPTKREGHVYKDSEYECVILDYCPIQTLRYQIFNEIRGSLLQFEIESVDQISIHTLKVDKNKLLGGWVEECDAKDDCSTLTETHRSIFAIVGPNKSNKNILVTTFNVVLTKKGVVDCQSSYLEFDEMKAGSIKSFDKIPDDRRKYIHIYFGERMHDSDYECQISDKYATIVAIWTHSEAIKRYTWNKPNPNNIDDNWQCEIDSVTDGNTTNYKHVMEFLIEKIKTYTKYAKKLDSQKRAAFKKKWIEDSLSSALAIYEGLADDQSKAIELVCNAFEDRERFVHRLHRENSIVQNIAGGFSTYCSTKVLDRGNKLKCKGKCNETCEVFKQETKIVRFSDVLIFAIDRDINDSKYTDLVGYEEFYSFDEQKYELYAVCNHLGGLGYGHYWAFVKGYDDGQWYEANDSRVSEINIDQVLEKETAILLFYKKM